MILGAGKWYSHQLTQEELKQFIAEAKTGRTNKNVWIGQVNPKTASRIREIIGENISKIMLESGAIRHSHSKKYHNLEDNDLLYSFGTINNATSIELSPQKHRDSNVLTFKGEINGGMVREKIKYEAEAVMTAP